MLQQAQEFLYHYWGLVVGALASGGVATAILASIIKGGITVLANKQSKDSKELRDETRQAISEIREDVAEIKEKMYLDAQVNAENPVIDDKYKHAYKKIGAKSTLEKIEDGLELVEKAVEVGTTITKHWTEL